MTNAFNPSVRDLRVGVLYSEASQVTYDDRDFVRSIIEFTTYTSVGPEQVAGRLVVVTTYDAGTRDVLVISRFLFRKAVLPNGTLGKCLDCKPVGRDLPGGNYVSWLLKPFTRPS